MEPCVVIASTCKDHISPDRIIKGILEKDDLPDALEIISGFRNYPWNISTKYYNATVHLSAMDTKTIGSQEFAESVNAVILCFDSTLDNGLVIADEWLAFAKEFEPEVKILVCESCSSDESNNRIGVSKIDAQKWCVKNQFELVELSPELNPQDSDSETEDDFPETLGLQRIVQALHAHIWPNLTMKSQSTEASKRIGPRVQDTSGENCGSDLMKDVDDDEFEKLFQNLGMLKSKAENLPPSERKDYAEKVATAFWKAMGGSESETDDLSLSDKDE